MTSSSSDDWICWHFGYNLSSSQAAQRYRYFHDLYFTVAHALGFSVSTSRFLATDLITETITSNHYEVFLSSTNFPWLSATENSELLSLKTVTSVTVVM
jgi:hypothetical protein